MMAGGLLQIAAFGAGAISFDNRLSKAAGLSRAQRWRSDPLGFNAAGEQL
jgi:hypothetical protein